MQEAAVCSATTASRSQGGSSPVLAAQRHNYSLAVLIPAWYERTPAARLTVASAATAPASSNGKIRKGTAVSRSVQTPRVPEIARSDGAVSPGIKRDCLDGARQVHGMEPAVAPRLPAGTIVSADGSFIPERSRNGKTIR